jgi:hypothetical protein
MPLAVERRPCPALRVSLPAPLFLVEMPLLADYAGGYTPYGIRLLIYSIGRGDALLRE